MSEDEKQQALVDLVNEKLMALIPPMLFDQGQLDEMKKPYHHIFDHIHPAHIYSTAGKAELYDLMPQMGINDPRVTDEMIERLPKTIDIDWEGQTHSMPLRVFKWGPARTNDIAGWETQMEKVYKARALVEKLEKSLSETFNQQVLSHISFGFGRSAKGDVLFVNFLDDKTWEDREAYISHIDAAMQEIPPNMFKDIHYMGPVTFH